MTTFYKIIATGLGSGYAPVAPGTAGAALASLMIGAYMELTGNQGSQGFQVGLIITILVITALGAYSSKKLEPIWGEDPSKIVIDEMVGLWISLLFVPLSWLNIFLAFVLFRIFDIWKPLGIRKMENIKHGWGVMLDDVLAGIYANFVLQIYLYFSVFSG